MRGVTSVPSGRSVRDVALTSPQVDRALARIRSSVDGAEDANELMARVADDLHELVPHDASTWFGADPVTLLATSPTRVEAFYRTECVPFWHREFHDSDTAHFVELARAPDPVSAMRRRLGTGVLRSPRYREMMQPNGYDDELRGALRVGSSTWGFFGLYRSKGRPAFDEDDVAVMRAVSAPIATAMRGFVRADNPWLGTASRSPGLLVFDGDSQVVSANDEAFQWLATLAPADDSPPVDLVSHRFDVDALDDHLKRVTTPVLALVSRARAVARGFDPTPARLRVRDQDGRWLLLHASTMRAAHDHDPASVAVVIEAARSNEVAPIIVEAHGLTPRERDVLATLARGATTSEIASELYLSPHTVRDHIKTLFDKVGVSSRAELVAKLYAEHYWEPGHADAVQLH